jgi:tRNA G18 (ribose-2'-O)-methylase SpoU
VVTLTPVDDPGDERLVGYTRLTDAEARRTIEGPEGGDGLFVVEGTTAIRRLLRSPYGVVSLLLSPTKAAALHDDLAAATTDAPAFVGARPVLDAVAGFPLHRGALALARRRPLARVEDVVSDAATVVVCEGVNDHENLGAVARTSVALGADALLLDPTTCDPLYRRCVRVSMGQILAIEWTRLAPWPSGLDALARQGFRLLALTPREPATPLDRVTRGPGDRVALLVGAEGPGLSDAALRAAERVRIPLANDVDSLNVGHALAIALFSLRAAAR